MRHLLPTLFLATLAAACGSSTPASNPAPAPSASAPAAPDVSASASAKADDSPPRKKGPFHWKDYAGPKVATKIAGKKAWAVIPVGLEDDFNVAKVALLDYLRTEKDEHVFKEQGGDEELWVPTAMVRNAEAAKGLAKGTALMLNVAAASGYGRITSIEKGDEGVVIKAKYYWGSSPSDAELSESEVIKLEDKIAFGQPVAYKSDSDWQPGQLVYTDKDSSWVVSSGGSPTKVATKDVKAMKVTKVYAKGDKVWAYDLKLEPAKVVEVLDGGVAYKVKLDKGGKEQTVTMDHVTAPL